MANQPTPTNPANKQQSPDALRTNSLGIDQKTLEQVVKKLDQAAPKDAKSKRGFVRWPYAQANVELLIDHAGGSPVSVRVAARNLSCGGLGILHRAFLHPGTKCRVRLRSTTRGIVEVNGVISRCAFKGGVIHDIGVRFDKTVDIHEFANPDMFEERFTLEKIKPEDLVGKVLYIEDSPMDTRLMKHYLRSTKLVLTMAATGEEGLKLAPQGFSVILCDFHLPDAEGPEIVRKIREAGVLVPIIAVTSDASRGIRDRLREMGAGAFLAKPLTEDRVQRAIAEYLLTERWAEREDPRRNLDTESAKVLDNAFAEELMAGKQLLAKLCTDDNANDAFALCARLATTARNLKFAEIATLAELAGQSLAQTMSCQESAQPIQAFLAACDKLADGKAAA